MKFRLRAGSHIESDGKSYKTGDTFDSDVDRAAQFGADKFERVHDFAAPQPRTITKTVLITEATLKGMSLAELTALAADEEIQLGTAKTKEEVVKVLKPALCG